MVFQVHSVAQKRKYFANTCSCAGCIAIIAAVLAVFLPALIAGIAGDVWQKDKLLWLQPDVTFTKDVIVTLHGSQSGASWVQTLSSSAGVNEVLGVDRALSIRVCETHALDQNEDGVSDELMIALEVPLAATESISGVQVALSMQSQFHGTAKMSSETPVVLSLPASGSVSSVFLTGKLQVHTTAPIQAQAGYAKPHAWPVMDFTAVQSASDVEIQRIAVAAAARNVSLSIPNLQAIWTLAAAAPASDVSALSPMPRTFTLTAQLYIPPSPVWVRPSVGELLKWAWVQYVAMGALLWPVLGWILSAIYDSRLVPVYRRDDLPAGLKPHAE